MKAGWEVKQLGDFSSIRYGYTAKASTDNVGPHFLRITDIQDGQVDWSQVPFCKINDKDRAKFALQNGDIVFARTGATTGKSYLLREDADAVFASYLILVRPTLEDLDPHFLSLYFQTRDYWEDVEAGTEGAAQGGFNASKLALLSIPIPPLEEQKRIVSVLDAAFEGLARAADHAETNLQNARALFESTLSFLFSKSKDWYVCALNDHVAFMDYRGKTPPKRESGVRLITAKNVKRGFIQVEPKEFIDKSAYDAWMTRGFPEEGDVLFTTEAPLANVAQLDTAEKVVIGQRLITMKPDRDKIDREFLKFALMSPQMQEQIFSYATGATVLGIKAKLLKTVKLGFPVNIEEQRKIACQCKASFEKMDELANIYTTKLADIADLRQSLLQKAFAGELT